MPGPDVIALYHNSIGRILASPMVILCLGVLLFAYKRNKIPYRGGSNGTSYVERGRTPRLYWLVVALYISMLFGTIHFIVTSSVASDPGIAQMLSDFKKYAMPLAAPTPAQ